MKPWAKVRSYFIFLLTISALVHSLVAAPPVVSNVQASQRIGSQLVDISYEVTDPDGGTVTTTVLVSADAGTNWDVPVFTLIGHVGTGVPLGGNRQIVWNAGVDWPGKFTDRCRVRIIADDGSGGATPVGMALVPVGMFQMGDTWDGIADAQPPHTVSLSPFFVDQVEVSQGLWEQVRQWATNHGYADLPIGNTGSFRSEHPVDAVTWYSAVKWCNARSEMENLTPVYYMSSGQTDIYRSGTIILGNDFVRWSANGYRLPTEAEWEKAARGGAAGLRYPWGNAIGGSNANYSGSGDFFEPGSTPVGYYSGNQEPRGTNMANGYRLYDMAGNVAEWCWDWYSSYPAQPQSNPHGQTSGSARVYRGGSFFNPSGSLGCARRFSAAPGVILIVCCPTSYTVGFRCVRSFGP